MTAGELVASFDLAWPTVSGHLAVLRSAGLVRPDRRGSTVTYRLDVPVLEEMVRALMEMFRLERPTTGPRT